MTGERPMTPFTFLLVDDDRELVATLAQRLRRRGYTVYTAFSGVEALARLAGPDTVDVVVLDLRMPESDGLETMAAMKAKHPLVEVIILTGHAAVPSAVEAVKRGAFDYLTKPCDLDTLLDRAEKAAAVKKDREEKILAIRMIPYISERERDRLIAAVLNG